MKIAVLDNRTPFITGGAQFMARDLAKKLNEFGHQAKIFEGITTFFKPRRNHIYTVLRAHLMAYESADMVIPIDPFTLYNSHHNSVPWLIYPSSIWEQAYHEYEKKISPYLAEQDVCSEVIKNCDEAALRRHKCIFTLSPMLAEMIYKTYQVKCNVLPVPFDQEDLYKSSGYGDYIFYPGRMGGSKRPILAVEAMLYTKTPVKLVLAGTGDCEWKIKNFISDNNLFDKVIFVNEFFSEDYKIRMFAACLGSIYLGLNETYWSLVVQEAMFSEKAVIAPTDTGATRDVVIDGETGYRPSSDPKDIADAMDKLWLDKENARRMGKNARELIKQTLPSWETAVTALVEAGMGRRDKDDNCFLYNGSGRCEDYFPDGKN